jgi:hypothetical protein
MRRGWIVGEFSETTYWVRIYSSGPIETAKNVLRAECYREGLCVTVEPTTFIYTGGEESGFVVGLINYPRFPSTADAIWARAEIVADRLLDACYQHSILLMAPDRTAWRTRRETA